VHAALRRIFSNNPVDDDCFFAIGTLDKKCKTFNIKTYRSVNQPFLPLNLLAVCVGLAGMRMNATRPITSVNNPYIRSVTRLDNFGDVHMPQWGTAIAIQPFHRRLEGGANQTQKRQQGCQKSTWQSRRIQAEWRVRGVCKNKKGTKLSAVDNN
jgi:hypothetical protein